MENIETEVDNMNNSVNINSGLTNDINMNSTDSNETTKSVNNNSDLSNTGSLDNTPSIAVNEASAFQENNSNGTSNICKKRSSSDIGVVKSTNLLKGNAFSSLLAYGGDSSSGDTDDDDDNDEDITEIRNEDQNNKMQVDKTTPVLSSGQQSLAAATNMIRNIGNVSSEPQTSNAVNNNNPIETNDKNQNDEKQIIYHNNNNNKNTSEISPIGNRTNTSEIRNNNNAFTKTQNAAVNIDDDDDTSSISSSSSSTSIAFSEDIDFSVDGSDEETDDDEDNGETTAVARKKKPNNRKNMTTEGELTLDDLPPIKDLHVSVPQDQCVLLGNILNIVDKLVVVQALKDLPALDLDTVLFLEWNKPLGQVFDVFGPVIEPLYCVRFNSTDHIQTKDVSVGLPVYFVPKSNHTRYVFLAQLMSLKGSDASWEDNNEPPREYLEYSDDEQERKANKILRKAGLFKKEVVKEEDASGPRKKRPTAYEQRMNERNLRISEIQKRRSQNRRSWNNQNQLIRSPTFMPPLPPCDYSASPTSSQSSSDNQPLFDFRSSFANNPPSPHNIMSDCRPKCLPSFGQNKHISLPPSPGFLRNPPPVPPQHLFQTSLSPWGPGSNIPVPPPATHPGLFSSPSIAGSNNISTGLRPNPPTNHTLGQSSHPFFSPPNFSQNHEAFLASFQSPQPPPPPPPPTISPHCQPNPFSTPPPTFTQTSTSLNTFSLPPLPSIPNPANVFSSPPPRIPYNSNEFPNLPPPPQFPQPVNVLPGFPNQNQPTFQNNFNRPSNPTPPNCRY